jgi:type IV pilus assembly protein PilB
MRGGANPLARGSRCVYDVRVRMTAKGTSAAARASRITEDSIVAQEYVAHAPSPDGEILALTGLAPAAPSKNGSGHAPRNGDNGVHDRTGDGHANGHTKSAGRSAKSLLRRIDAIGHVLLERRVITPEQLARAMEIQRESGRVLGHILVETGALSEQEMARAVARQWGLPYVDLAAAAIDPDAVRMMPASLAQRHSVIAIERRTDRLVVAMADPSNVVAIDDIRLLTGLDVEIVIAAAGDIARAQGRVLGAAAEVEALAKAAPASEAEVLTESTGEDLTVERLRSMVEEAPIVRIVNQIIHQAIRDGASDIHFEPREQDVHVRFRVDGLLNEAMTVPKQIQAALASRVKILANLDIAERRLPQDGHIRLRHEGRKYDMRVSTLPTVLGEKIVIRVLDQSGARVALNEIGLPAEMLNTWGNLITRPYGMLIVTGPTGSGKTTTLYTSIERINTAERNIVSIEDPVEYRMPRVSQVQVNPRTGLTFASGLRSILRQDPDVVLIGEIRDRETAQIAVQASMTGHLVLSTLHTNDAPSAVTRLADMGVEPFLVTGSLMAVLAQRLVRTICSRCKEAYTPPSEALRRLGLQPEKYDGLSLHRGRGCDFCRGSGYRGRTGVFGLMVMNDRLRARVLAGASADQLRAAAEEEGMWMLRRDALQKVLDGVTTVEELFRVVLMADGVA